MTNKYSGTNIFRRCGQLSIPYGIVISSHRFRGKDHGYCKLAYNEGTKGTIDWGINKRDIVIGEDVLSYDKKEMLEFLKKKIQQR